ncbi:hypothetical protein AGMMS49593_01780 [Endomicrobiia bacterium]|nr:hypothetical protein AGMMS49593_01780 [Endomicrobiia bacterium]
MKITRHHFINSRSLKAICAIILFSFALSSCPQCPNPRPIDHHPPDEKIGENKKIKPKIDHGQDQDSESLQSPPVFTLNEIANIKLFYTEGKTNCSYQVGDTTSFNIPNSQSDPVHWVISKQEQKKLQLGSLYILVHPRKDDDLMKDTISIDIFATADKGSELVVDRLKFRRSDTNHLDEGWVPIPGSGQFMDPYIRPDNLKSSSSNSELLSNLLLDPPHLYKANLHELKLYTLHTDNNVKCYYNVGDFRI